MDFWTFLYIKTFVVTVVWFLGYCTIGAIWALDLDPHFRFAILPLAIWGLVGVLYFLFLVW